MCEQQIWTYCGLDWQSVLWHMPEMGLQTAYTWHLHAGVNPKIDPKIQARIPSASTTLPLCPNAKAVWQWGPVPSPPRQVSPFVGQGYKAPLGSDWEHPLLHPHHQPHSPHGAKHNYQPTGQRHRTYHAKNKTNPQLLGNASWCNSLISCISHDTQHPFGCILPIRGKCPQQIMQSLFHGLETRPNKPHQAKWRIFHAMHNFKICCSIDTEAELGALFLNCKQATIFQLTFKEWGIHNPPCTYIAITWPQAELQTTQWNTNNPNQWKWDFSGLRMQWNRVNLTSNVTQGKNT